MHFEDKNEILIKENELLREIKSNLHVQKEIKEKPSLNLQREEEMQTLINKMTGDIVSYKKEIEEMKALLVSELEIENLEKDSSSENNNNFFTPPSTPLQSAQKVISSSARPTRLDFGESLAEELSLPKDVGFTPNLMQMNSPLSTPRRTPLWKDLLHPQTATGLLGISPSRRANSHRSRTDGVSNEQLD